MTQVAERATQVIDTIYSKSLGGSGSSPDVAQFKSQLQNATNDQVAKAHDQMWSEIITPLAQQGGEPLPTNVVEECSLLTKEMVRRFQQTGTRS